MKILWIVNSPIGIIGEKLYGKRQNGVWMDALLESFKEQSQYRLIVATTAKIKEIQKFDGDGIVYYAVPDTVPILYNEERKSNILAWKNLIETEKPDLIQVWGTEFTHGLCALRAAKNIPSVIYMQGYLGSIARHYLAGMTHGELKKTVTIRDIIKRDSILLQQKKYYKSAEKEKEMFSLAGRIISENEWCNTSIKSVVPDVGIYNCPLSVNGVFESAKWDIQSAEPHSIICNASGYPLKGLHMALRAVALLKRKYTDIKLYVPGAKVVSDGSVRWLLRKRGYTKYIEKLIKDLGIEEQIVWLGALSQKELARHYATKRAFLLCSAIENHSSSLKEAMIVGTPSVASAVGGIPEYVRHGDNGFLYRFEEYEIMAGYIEKIFDDDGLAQRLSGTARTDMISLHGKSNILKTVTDIYRSILGE